MNAFRAEVRAWLDEHAPAKGSAEDFSAAHLVSATTVAQYEAGERAALDLTQRWQRQLYDAGWAGRSWPVEYGGHGGPEWQSAVAAEEQSRYGVSTKMLAVALEMVPPVLFAHGSHDQRLRHLPEIVGGDEAWWNCHWSQARWAARKSSALSGASSRSASRATTASTAAPETPWDLAREPLRARLLRPPRCRGRACS
jgi:alkylation response protein AidB-like acyl-CoA dehydrogenase